MGTQDFEIKEYDASTTLIKTYVLAPDGPRKRIDAVVPTNTKSPQQRLLDVFLPAGYPHSVTEDYTRYRIFDSLQSFASSVAGLLSNRAVLQGVGVGDVTATPNAALMLSVLQDSTGRIGTILFAHKFGTALEPDCKMYRLLADILNDAAMVMDCLSPVFPKRSRVLVLCLGSLLRSLCGVAAGSSKASLCAHFAKCGNLGEINAKGSSQETIMSLAGLLAGSYIVSRASSQLATWTMLFALICIHLATSYAAVRAVRLRFFNKQRANIMLAHLLDEGKVLTPREVSKMESVFENSGLLRRADQQTIGKVSIGLRFEELVRQFTAYSQPHALVHEAPYQLADLLEIYDAEDYILWFNATNSEAAIVLKKNCTFLSQLQAWLQALSLAAQYNQRAAARSKDKPLARRKLTREQDGAEPLVMLRTTLAQSRATLEAHRDLMREAGWVLDTGTLETKAGTRVVIRD